MTKNILPVLLADFYKVSHKKLYDTESAILYSTWTPRKSRMEGVNEVVVFGLQGFVKKYLIDYFNENFFQKDIEEIIKEYERILKNTIGGEIETQHIRDLHKVGYLPIEILALPEGTLCPIRVPMFTIRNTKPEFYWVTNFLETLMSAEIWKPMTSATIALQYRKILEKWASKTCDNNSHVDFQGHDFSFRGLTSVECACTSGAGHLTVFKGTDTIPAICYLENYYNADVEKEVVASSVPASEHSIMEFNSYGKENDEYDAFKRITTEVHPSGFVSIVSDTWNLWKVLTDTCVRLKDEIMNRDGRVVIRPDCYTDDTEILTEDGWKLFKNLNKGEKVAQYHEDGSIDFTLPLKYVDEYYKGDMYKFRNTKNNIDLCVTPNHRMVKRSTKTGIQVIEAENIKYTSYQDYVCAGRKVGTVDHLTPMEKLMIVNQADGRGRSSYQEKQNGRYTLEFQFAKERKIERLKQICEEGGFEYKMSKPYSRKFSEKNQHWNDQVNIYVYLNQQPTKHFREYFDLKDKSYLWCREFIEEVSHWDATRRTETRFKYDNTDKADAEFVQLVSILAGYRTKFSIFKDNRSDKFKDTYNVNIITNRDYLGGLAVKKEKVSYEGRIYCVQVPTGMLVVRRNNQVSISGNSGNPCDIICGLNTTDELVNKNTPYANEINKGVIELLWDTFGGTINSKGYKVLDSHIGCIYGDAITLERAEEICKRLESKGFASSNIVLGIGSYTYNMNTRDTFGFALKTTYGVVNGKELQLYKDPITDDGTKKSQKGIVAVIKDENGKITYKDNLNQKEWLNENKNLLEPVFLDGELLRDQSLQEIREILRRH